MSDIKMERVSPHWATDAQAEYEKGVDRMQALDGAWVALQKEPYVVPDSAQGMPAKAFWGSVLNNGEIHLATDSQGILAIHILSGIRWGLWASWEAAVPPKRRQNPAVLESAHRVIEYCFAPSGLGLLKLKAVVHPENTGAIHYLLKLGFKKRAILPNEASFKDQPSTMILWELDNPFLKVDDVQPEPDTEEEEDVWNTAAGDELAEPDANVPSGDSNSPYEYEPVPDPWSVLQRVTDSQLSMAGAANSVGANAGGSPSRVPAPRRAKNYWES